uniref:Uncharacterized protein n=1 Tax=Timema cristinae TaxID=61476 RepID=A0A7R9CJ31_TIMCR|nr:unnamed protein product [Timema cristinae]
MERYLTSGLYRDSAHDSLKLAVLKNRASDTWRENNRPRVVQFNTRLVVADKAPSEATFRGTEFLSYDLSRTGGEPIVSTQDAISLTFKTRQPSGLLFYTGSINLKDYKRNCSK